jgi:Flp pilus assembly protein TadG
MTELHRLGVPGAWRAITRGISTGAKRPVNYFRRLWADTSAVTAIEVAMIGFPFFSLVVGTFAIGLWYFYTASVDEGIYKGTRAFMTGKFQMDPNAKTMAAGDFTRKYVCSQMPTYIPCSATNPALNITVVSDFKQLIKQTPVPPLPAPTLYFKDTLLPLTPNFCVPQQGDIVYVQALYSMPNIFGFFGLFHQTITSGATVQVEQFPSGAAVYHNC